MFINSEQKRLLDKLSKIDGINNELNSLLKETNETINELKTIELAINKIIEERTQGFPWLADAISQYYEKRDLKISEFLEHKLRPAISSADRVREIASEKRFLEKKFRLTRNLIKYYESLFPWLPEYVDIGLDELIEQITIKEENDKITDDPVKFYLTKAEYQKLSTTERNQIALDRYYSKKKSSWEIGRDYERYIGYLYEINGFSVYYQGIEEGLEDLGRDLVVKKKNEIKIIQCKYWAQYKTIHEKHICQLFGTTLKYWVEQKNSLQKRDENFLKYLSENDNVKGVFVTSIILSDVAREFANELGIDVKEKVPLKKYPSIKCNISKKTGEKIYHLPMDQQYDRTKIEIEKGQLYVETVSEAEKLGFRRAWKWKGNTNE